MADPRFTRSRARHHLRVAAWTVVVLVASQVVVSAVDPRSGTAAGAVYVLSYLARAAAGGLLVASTLMAGVAFVGATEWDRGDR